MELYKKHREELIGHLGWFVIDREGSLIKEGDAPWSEASRDVVCAGIVSSGRIYVLPANPSNCFESKTACASIGSGKIDLVSRNIGYRAENQEITLRVDISTGDCVLDVR